MDRQRLILTIVGIVLIVALMIYLHIEGFAQFSSYRSFDLAKRGSRTLCDPCYDPDCKTDYPPTQDECNNRAGNVVPTGTPFLPRYTTPTVASTSSVAAAAPRAAATVAAAAPRAAATVAAAAPRAAATVAAAPTAASSTVTMTATDFYNFMQPQIIKTVRDALATKGSSTVAPSSPSSAVTLSPASLPAPMQAAFGPASQQMNSPAMRQGDDYSGCKPFNKDEYIRKDSIPCWGCSIPAPY